MPLVRASSQLAGGREGGREEGQFAEVARLVYEIPILHKNITEFIS